MIVLESLLKKFKPLGNYEYKGAIHLTHVPLLGRLAYLNIIHTAAHDVIQHDIIDPLRLPDQLRRFYRTYNGADLFSDLMSVYGFFPKTYLYERTDERRSYPYNILDLNARHFNEVHSSEYFLFGSYGFDRSVVFTERRTGRVHCAFGEDMNRIRTTWEDFETWIRCEIDRLSKCFDEYGNRLVELEETLPGMTN